MQRAVSVNHSPKRRRERRLFDAVNTCVFVLLCALMIFPFINVICLSLEPEWIASESGVIHLIPRQPTLEAYAAVFRNPQIKNVFFNSFVVTLGGTISSLLVTAMMAYGLSLRNAPGVKFISYVLIFIMTFKVDIIPLYILVKELGLMNNLLALVLTSLATVRNILLMRVFFEQLPSSLREAAMLDNCNEVQYFFRVALPLSKPIMATIALFYAEDYWNEFLKATMFIQDASKKTVQVFLREILIENATMETTTEVLMGKNLKMAVVVVSIIPILCVYPFLQKYFTKGIMLGAVKG